VYYFEVRVKGSFVLLWFSGESGPGFLTHLVCALCPLQVLEQARVEVPLFPFNIVEFSFQPFPPLFAEEMKNSVSRWVLLKCLIIYNLSSLRKVMHT
jgi:hypothetical protein